MNHSFFAAGILLAAAAAGAAPAGGLNWTCTKHATIKDGRLTVVLPTGATNASANASAPIDLSAYSNATFCATIRVSGRDIAKPPVSWSGLKFMLHYTDPETGAQAWPGAHGLTGTFGPTNLMFTVPFVGAAPRKATLTLGLEHSSGTLAFDLQTLRIEKKPPLFTITNQGYRVQYPARVKATPPLRGVMLPGGPCTEDDFRTLADWGATLARYQMCRNWGRTDSDTDLADYNRWLDGKLDHLEQVLAWAKRYGLKIVVDLHVPPGGRLPGDHDMRMFYEPRYADAFVACWKKIAARFKGRPEIFGFDLINEPSQNVPAAEDYWALQRRAAEAVRAIDPETPIIIESNGWDSPVTYSYLSPLAMDNVIYQAHMYLPHQYTHQGVATPIGSPRLAYPNPARGWDAAYIRSQLRHVREFQLRHHARIYIGEFSAIAWAPGAERYIADCMALFNEYGWDWTYHAFREWPGWSVEHAGANPGALRPAPDTPRKRALLEGLRRLPPLLATGSGKPAATAAEWESARRPEILRLFESTVFGRRPVERPDTLRFEPEGPATDAMDGRAVRKRIAIRYAGPGGQGAIHLLAFIPKAARPAPAFLLIDNRDPAENIDPDRVRRTDFWPAEEIVSRGYAALAFWNGDVAPDHTNNFHEGVFKIFGPAARTADSWGTLSAWAWGASRVMDWIETEPLLDARHVAVIGHSRGGKTALWAGATDPRFALVISNDSGCGGAKLNRMDLPKSETIALITGHFTHWFCLAFAAYAGRENELPVDSHELLALVAPRLLYVASASLDAWAGQPGEFRACQLASPAWALYGKPGLVGDSFPPPETPLEAGTVAYHLRTGKHDLAAYDWQRYLAFADANGFRKE